jgi:hypothetical protein
VTKLDKRFTATLVKSPAKGGWTAGDTIAVHATERIDRG